MIDDDKVFERVLEKILKARPPEEAAKALVEAQLFLERRKARSKVIEALERILQQTGDRIQSLRDSGLIELGDKEFPFDYSFPDEQEHLIRHQLELLRAWNEGVAVTGSTEAPPYQGTQHLEPYKGLLRQNPSCYPGSPTYFSIALRVVDEGLRTGPNHSWFGFDSQRGYKDFLKNHLPRVPQFTFAFWEAMREGYGMTPIFFKDDHGDVWSGMKNPVQQPFYFKKKPWGLPPDQIFLEPSYRCTLPSRALVPTLISLHLTDGASEWLADSNSSKPIDLAALTHFSELCATDGKADLPFRDIAVRLQQASDSKLFQQAVLRKSEVEFLDHGIAQLIDTIHSLQVSDIFDINVIKSSEPQYGLDRYSIASMRKRVRLLREMADQLKKYMQNPALVHVQPSWRFLQKVSA